MSNDPTPRRRSIELPGFGHENPIPVASRIGPFVYSGAITGKNLETRAFPDSLDEQVAIVFGRIRDLMAVAGGTVDDIIKLSVHLADPSDRSALNREWLAMFPDADSRPARHVSGGELSGGALVNVELVAILPD
ncbi:enamine deaminase RidA [Pseudoclavibacter endophyticus]|uniref:RidA family protein n=1 Tax=Pseudoclavibacter endophyticus TaxID=1778590 RepID=A0A6H9WIZ7_9MICO|nr:Rid family hydrolase [Pseudoclavibacter endophyticus]KAB1646783.1 RidA family protein [Pseudoclavibacter endophyticus]GGA75585.1 enamine deaminase RidA [Pseudoclavibacter endophyticus]